VADRPESERKRLVELGFDPNAAASPVDISNALEWKMKLTREKANKLCSESRAGDFRTDSARPKQIRATLTGVGLADLLKVTETVVGYQVREIADASNVLPREHWERRSRLITESEVERITTQAMKDVQSTNVRTSDRFELSSETQKTVNTKFSVDAGVDVSAKYGVVKVDASLDVGFSRDSTDSRTSASSFAQEVVRETVESIEKSSSESVRRLMRESRTESFSKGIDRTNDSTGYTGFFFWLDKVHELQIRSWGTRLMAEFYVLDPPETVVTRSPVSQDGPAPPPPLDFTPSEISVLNYLCFAKRYQTSDVAPPPPQYKSVGWSWSSSPDESAENNGEDTNKGIIEIPNGYVPISARVITASMNNSDTASWFIDLGGQTPVSEDRAVPYPHKVDFTSIETDSGLHVVLRVRGHFDKTGVANAFIKCRRTTATYEAWQVRTWGAYLEGYQALEAEYRRAVDQASFDSAPQPVGRNPESKRRLERTELKKWVIEALRGIAGEPPGSPSAAPAAIRFYEQAFEWPQMAYVFYGYQWATPELQPLLRAAEDPDATHEAFLGAGAARVLVSITPGYEGKVINFLESQAAEADRVDFEPDDNYAPTDIDLSAAWQELVRAKDSDLVVGVGSLNVKRQDATVTVNPGTTSSWTPAEIDVGRALVIEGAPYKITSVDIANSKLTLDRKYEGVDNSAARYLAGSRELGPPWRVAVPSSLVALHEGLAVINATPQWMPTPVRP
jgi:hypothetical protein